ncbi:MAG: VCBS repeat-containing protein [Verrucomicrobiota bacterium]
MATTAASATNLTGTLAATQLTGTIADARLSANVSLLGNNIDTTEIVNGTIANVDIDPAANIADTKLATINAAGKVANSATTATSLNTPSAIVARDASGNFSAGTVTGTFAGNGAGLTNVSLLAASPAWAITLTTNVGTFGFSLASAPLVGTSPGEVVSADFNSDGKLDLANINVTSGTVTVLTNNGVGSFMLASSLPVGLVPRSLAVTDVNGDTKLDLICANNDSWNLSVLTNRGGGNFSLASTLSTLSFPTCVRAGDINNDGKPDLVVSYTTHKSLTLLTNNGTGGFTEAAPQATSRFSSALAVAELNGDGALDLLSVASTTPGTLTVMLGAGNGTFVEHGTNQAGTGLNSPFCMIATDVNGDGKPDAVCANSGDDTLTVLTNNGGGTFGFRQTVSTGNNPLSVAAGDFNGDGKLDLVTPNYDDNTVSVLTNNGTGTFGLALSAATGMTPISLTTADVNSDGALDVCVANQSDDTISILQNTLSLQTTSATFQGNFNAPTLTVNGTLTAAGLFTLGQSSFSASAGSTLTPPTSHVQIFPNVLAAVTLNTTTAIANGTTIGQVLILKGSGLFAVTVPDNANTQLQADRALGSGDTLFLIWDGSDWNEVSYSNN